MAKKKNKVPKSILGFKLSKGTRKDLKKLLKMVSNPDTRTIAMAAASGLAAYLSERFGEHRQQEQVAKGTTPGLSAAH